MDGLFELTITIFALVLITGIIEQLLSNDKTAVYIKPALYGAIIITIISFFSKINLFYFESSNLKKYSVDSDLVWQSACEDTEDFLKKDMIEQCKKNNLAITDLSVDISTNMKDFEIERIEIHGRDSNAAKNFISQYYDIDSKYIYIKTEE